MVGNGETIRILEAEFIGEWAAVLTHVRESGRGAPEASGMTQKEYADLGHPPPDFWVIFSKIEVWRRYGCLGHRALRGGFCA